jgi:uncharacterized protein YjeT (DUF2065 family)
MNWQDIGIGLSLVLVIEGLLPFISPSRYQRMLEAASGIGEGRLRIGGAVCMGVGILLLYIVN